MLILGGFTVAIKESTNAFIHSGITEHCHGTRSMLILRGFTVAVKESTNAFIHSEYMHNAKNMKYKRG
jgi:hypothetical protein